jgi:hypothetical protein
MKTPSLLLIIVVCRFACSSNVKLEKLNHPRYRYVDDFDSRMALQNATTKARN